MNRLILATALLGTAAQAEPWEEVVPKVAERATFIMSEVARLGGADLSDQDVGYFDFDVEDEHRCAILGRMFGLTEQIAHLEDINEPTVRDQMSRAEVVALKLAGLTLESWVRMANAQLLSDVRSRVASWNANCPGRLEIDEGMHVTYTTGPAFTAFPATTYLVTDTPPAMPDFNDRDRWATEYQTRIRDGLLSGANFAAYYSVISFSCGPECEDFYMADRRTGQVFKPPFGGEVTNNLLVNYRLDSALIYVRHRSDAIEGPGDLCLIRAWRFDGQEFILESEEQTPFDDVCRTYRFRVVTD